MNLTSIDWIIMLLYFAFVLGIGVFLKRFMKTSTDFFLAGRALPAWVCGLAFISANLGAQEVIGMAASGAKYGIATSHFYWIGAIPAMVFVGVFMMPFYYGSRARSVPEYLRLRFDEKTRGLNAISFAIMTVFSSGISMYAMAKLIQTLHILDAPLAKMGMPQGWSFHISIAHFRVDRAGVHVARRIDERDLQRSAAIFPDRGRVSAACVPGTEKRGRMERVEGAAAGRVHAFVAGNEQRAHKPAGHGMVWVGDGLGFVLSFGYWCTDFLVVQRAMAADSMSAARRTPLIAALPKMLFPILVILPGMIAIALPNMAPPPAMRMNAAGQGQAQVQMQALNQEGKGLIPAKVDMTTGQPVIDKDGKPVLDYDLAIPNMLLHYFPTGILGLGLTALLASFMSGMAGNVTAFNTVWTYDIYQSYIRKGASDAHYLQMGRFATVFGIFLSIGAAYATTRFNDIMDFLQLVFAFVNAPLFATFLLGMFWKRTTGHGAFFGLLSGTAAAAVHHGLSLPEGSVAGIKGGWITLLHTYPSDMAQNFWTAIWAWTTCFVVTILISLLTRPRPEKELVGLVYSMTERPSEGHLPWYQRPAYLGVAVLALALMLNLIFR